MEPADLGDDANMTRPQQQEIARSDRGEVVEEAAKAKATSLPMRNEEGMGPVPEENQPGHRPEKDQDKPEN